MATCPHCRKPVTIKKDGDGSPDARPVQREVYGALKKEVLYSCPHCDCVLGFGHFLGGMITGRP